MLLLTHEGNTIPREVLTMELAKSTVFMDVKMVLSFDIEHNVNSDLSELIDSKTRGLDIHIEKLIEDKGMTVCDYRSENINVIGEDEF
jgi:hypothetical protein